MRPLWLVLVLALSAGCAEPAASDPYAGPPSGSTKDLVSLKSEEFLMPPFGAPFPFHARVTLDVLSGGPIDAWLATMEECQNYGQKRFAPAGKLLGATAGTFEADLPAGDACLVLDNASFAEGEATPRGDVIVEYRIDVWERPA